MESTRNKLIKLLAENRENYISGQRLSEKLSISRAAIWKHMKELEKDGYQIEGKSKKGYRIISFPEKLSKNTIKWGLGTEWLGNKVIHKEVVTSTQHIAHQLAREEAVHGTIVIADQQTNGKGRMSHGWDSADQLGIWMSLILRPAILPTLAPQLTLLTATVLADVLTENTDTSPEIKWPNDVLLYRKKTAGILTEMQAEQDTIQYIVVGIGMNVNHARGDLPVDIQQKATSLAIETKRDWNTRDLVQSILKRFETAYDNYIQSGFSEVKKKWEEYGFRVGETIQIKTSRESYQAAFKGIADDGALLIETGEGNQKIYSAEIDWGGDLYADKT